MMLAQEEVIALENLAQNQRRVFNDACDSGLPHVYFDQVRDACRNLLREVGGYGEHALRDQSDPNNILLQFRLPIERDAGEEHFLIIDVTRHRMISGKSSRIGPFQESDFFFSIDIRRKVEMIQDGNLTTRLAEASRHLI